MRNGLRRAGGYLVIIVGAMIVAVTTAVLGNVRR